MSAFFNNMSDFIIQNNVLTTMVAVTLAFSTGTFIRSLVSDIIMPLLYFIIFNKITFLSGAFKSITSNNIDNFIKEIFQFILVIIFTFIIIVQLLKNYIFKSKPVKQPTSTNQQSSGNTAGAVVTDGFTDYYY
jgi:large-conductance mechanosensitive channel